MNKNDLGKSPAFPRNPFRDPNGTWSESSSHDGTAGMDLRTYIATKCLAGICANHTFLEAVSEFFKGDIEEKGYAYSAREAVRYADALIAELSKNT